MASPNFTTIVNSDVDVMAALRQADITFPIGQWIAARLQLVC